ncbi:bacillithiol system redox-active protein YtxJ [Algoriphagus sediminis]|uniref:Bacillithiol system redox-active protein YtxJ n=1 Tax=Algoriphagus sediminis TaxID=3057113 RepID=A0ABT7YCT7_9BACT|nr:bacillithiol system redox-active protein YtxJ [Algoriphagus sediminis]MDN3204334.1 bacillithiol system redox-active protein YtxJ [Algoriphagus sediminis]
MNWKELTTEEQLEEIKRVSKEKPVLIFKHSTRCSISSMSLNRLLRKWQESDSQKVEPYFLDLIAHRDISDLVARQFEVYHQSPQAIIIKNGKAVYDSSHFNISYQDILSQGS